MDARCTLETAILRHAAYWKQQGKCQSMREGARILASSTPSPLSPAPARELHTCPQVDDNHVMGHAAKANALLAFYSGLLGRTTVPFRAFSLEPSTRVRPGCTTRLWWLCSPLKRSCVLFTLWTELAPPVPTGSA
ncbi:hypothetical protein ZWY2020_004339 [Hordeum vulgare]|nr:hypothetical protein ZWY2020_004339 [Hordeum vulgare]